MKLSLIEVELVQARRLCKADVNAVGLIYITYLLHLAYRITLSSTHSIYDAPQCHLEACHAETIKLDYLSKEHSW